MKRAFLLLAVVAVCLAQTATPPAISAYYRLAGNSAGPYPYQWLIVDPPLALSFDGTSPHLSISAIASLDVHPGVGVLCVSQVNGSVVTLQCSIDTAVVAYRVDPPAGPGPCVDPVTNLPYGAGAYAADGAHHYECVQGATGWVWVASSESAAW